MVGKIFVFFYVNIPCMKCEDSCCILKIIHTVNFYNRKYGWLEKQFFLNFFMLTFLE